MRQRLNAVFISIVIIVFMAMFLPVPIRAAGADDYKTYEYYRSQGLEAINAAQAYALGYTGKGIILALFDQPVRLDHIEFLGKDFLDRYLTAPIGEWRFDNSHGTHVGGIMAANKNGYGMHGVAFDAGLFSLGAGNNMQYAILTLYPIIFNHDSIKVINNSWGHIYFPEYSLKPKDLIYAAVSPELQNIFRQAISAHDKVLVWAAGNSGHLSPDAHPSFVAAEPEIAGNIINVIAFDPQQNKSDSTFLAVFSEHALFMEEHSIAAPGVSVYSAVPTGNGDEYGYKQGTSMAAPFVSGSVGLVQQAFPYMNGKQLVDTVLSTADNSFFKKLPSYTVVLQEENTPDGKIKINSIYMVYFDDSGDSPEKRDADLRAYYNNSPNDSFVKLMYPTVNEFLADYYTPAQNPDLPPYGKERYYLNVPPEIMFGQGTLDVGKAVQGPGLLNARRLTKNDYSKEEKYNDKEQALYTINTQGYNSVWSNDIGEKKVEKYSEQYRDFLKQMYGGFFKNGLYPDEEHTYEAGEKYGDDYWVSLNKEIRENKLHNLPVGLKKEGAGILALTGENTYTGDSIVTGGTLQIDGSVNSNVYSESGGTVAGKGTIGENLINRGTVQPGSWGNAGELKVSGNFISSGLIKIVIQGNTNGKLTVDGSADVNGSQVTVGGIATPNQTYQFLSATNGISGVFRDYQFSPFLQTEAAKDLSRSDSTASFTVTKTAALNSLANLNPRQMASAGALENMYNYLAATGQQWPTELLMIYNLPTEAAAGRAFQETYGSTQASLAASLPLREQFSQIVGSRFAALKGQDNLAANNDWWFKFIDGGKTVKEDRESGLPEIKPNRSGFITGYDKKINQSWRLGALFGYGRGKLFTPDARGDSQDRRLGLYGSYNRQALDLNMYLAAGRQSHDVKRSLPSIGRTADSKYHGTTWEIGVKAKYDLHYGQEKAWHLAPYAALDVERYNQDAYSESGAGALSQQGEKFLNIYSTAGFGLDASRKINKGHYLVTAGYKRVLNGDNPAIKVNLASNPQGKFFLRSNKESRDWLVLGFSAEGELAENWTIAANLNCEFSGRGNNRSAGITFKRYW